MATFRISDPATDWLEACKGMGLVAATGVSDEPEFHMWMRALGLSDNAYWLTVHKAYVETGMWSNMLLILASHVLQDARWLLAVKQRLEPTEKDGLRFVLPCGEPEDLDNIERVVDLSIKADEAGATGHVYKLPAMRHKSIVGKVVYDPKEASPSTALVLNETAMHALAYQQAPDFVAKPLRVYRLGDIGVLTVMENVGMATDQAMRDHATVFRRIDVSAQDKYWATVMSDVATALQQMRAHDVALTHADLYPRNVCVKVDDEGCLELEPHTKIIDFGRTTAVIGPAGSPSQQYVVGTGDWNAPTTTNCPESRDMASFALELLIFGGIVDEGRYLMPDRVRTAIAGCLGIKAGSLQQNMLSLSGTLSNFDAAFDASRRAMVFADFPGCTPVNVLAAMAPLMA